MASVDLGIVVIVRFAFALPRPLLLFSLTQSNIVFSIMRASQVSFSGMPTGKKYVSSHVQSAAEVGEVQCADE